VGVGRVRGDPGSRDNSRGLGTWEGAGSGARVEIEQEVNTALSKTEVEGDFYNIT